MSIFPPERFGRSDFRDRLVGFRRDLHRHPELAFEEVRTAALVATRLEELSIPTRTGIAGTGVVGLVEGGRPGPTVLVRADMDALPLVEDEDRPYRSTLEGKMHACGHDAHVAIALGVAEILAESRSELPGRVKLVFQPAEEGPGGAKPMIEAGVLADPQVDYAIGLHVWSHLAAGEIGILAGPAMAAVDTFTARVTAPGGHGAAPHQTPDPIVTASAVIQAWQSVVSRETDPLEPALLSVCMVQGGTAPNIIPNQVALRGTVRTFDEDLRATMPRSMERILSGVTRAYGCGHRFDWESSYPATVNDPRVAALMEDVVIAMGGRLGKNPRHRPCMGGEDMSYFLRAVPGCFAFLGAASPDSCPGAPHHSSRFDVDEACLPLGVEFLVRSAERLLVSGLGSSSG